MNDKTGPALLDIATKHLERANEHASHAEISAHKTLDDVITRVRHQGWVAALNEAITGIRKLADGWADAAQDYAAQPCDRNRQAEEIYTENARALNDLAFQLLSKVDEA